MRELCKANTGKLCHRVKLHTDIWTTQLLWVWTSHCGHMETIERVNCCFNSLHVIFCWKLLATLLLQERCCSFRLKVNIWNNCVGKKKLQPWFYLCIYPCKVSGNQSHRAQSLLSSGSACTGN